MVQFSSSFKFLNGSVFTLSNWTEPLPIVSYYSKMIILDEVWSEKNACRKVWLYGIILIIIRCEEWGKLFFVVKIERYISLVFEINHSKVILLERQKWESPIFENPSFRKINYAIQIKPRRGYQSTPFVCYSHHIPLLLSSPCLPLPNCHTRHPIMFLPFYHLWYAAS